MASRCLVLAAAWALAATMAFPQALPVVTGVEGQPVMAQAVRLKEALEFLGSGLGRQDAGRIEALRSRTPDAEVVREIQAILDPYCLAMVHINPEARVKVAPGPAAAELIQSGWKTFLVKVHNEAAVTSPLEVESPNAQPALHRSTGAHNVRPENVISEGELAQRFLELTMYRRRPLLERLSGLELEYAVLQAYTTATGKREANIGFHVGQGTQDIGFRNAIDVLFDIKPSVKVVFRVKDYDGKPTTGSFLITDGVERLIDDPQSQKHPADYRNALASRPAWQERDADGGPDFPEGKRLQGIYPLPSRRVAYKDDYPDFFFHPQIYRSDGEHVMLPAGNYSVTYTRGPEYQTQTRTITVPEGKATHEVSFQLERWTNLARLGWYSADHHVHAAGCSHYESPQEGVKPEDMFREVLGEDLNVASVLTWGPCWYYQKNFFEGGVHPLSTKDNIIRYDVEVSGFPSSHAGHLCLLRLSEDDYPGTTKVEEWPSWTLPILQWAKGQNAAVGYSHSGWGLEPVSPTDELPNNVMAKFDGIGANEYVVTVTHDAVDFYSAGDTPINWELNMWYHSLNVGYRTRISGETDYPCIYDDRLGLARTYAKLDGKLDFDVFVDRLKEGRSYVSEGRAHIIDFAVNRTEVGVNGSEVRLASPGPVKVKARVAAYLSQVQDPVGAIIAARALDKPPYWHIERARVGQTRNVAVELIVNGKPVARKEILADGAWKDVAFDYNLDRSSWIALRVFAAAHTNPIFALVGGKPIRASRESAEWCRRAVDQCWRMKSPRIRESELDAAKAAYDHARRAYDRILAETPAP
jgi:hypothetical protein